MTDPFQPALFAEDIYTALLDVVRALGGLKTVATMLRPQLKPDDAGRWLANCLNPDKAEKLDYEQIMWILREGRRIGCHTGMHFLNTECGYAPPTAIEPDDEAAELQRHFIEAVKYQARIVERMEKLRNPMVPVTLGDRRRKAA